MKKIMIVILLMAVALITTTAHSFANPKVTKVENTHYIERFSSTQTVTMYYCDRQYSFSFYSNGTYSGYTPNGSVSGSYSINGANSISLDGSSYRCLIGLVNGSYTLNAFDYGGYQYARKAKMIYN